MAFVISTIYKAVDKLSPVIKQMERANTSFAAKQDKMFNKLGKSMSNMTTHLASLAGGLSIASLAFMGGNAIVKFDDSLASLSAVTGVTGRGLENMKGQIMDLADKSKIAAYDVAKGFEIVGSNMSQYLTDPKGLRLITEAGITLAKASRMELEPALDSLTTVMNQFGFEANKAQYVINKLTAGEIVGNVRTSEMADMLKEFGANAKLSNVSLEESVALIQTLGKYMQKSKVDVASRNLLTILSAAGGLDKTALKDMAAAGVNTNVLMDKTKTLSERLKELKKAAGSSVAMVHIFGKENLTAGQVAMANIGLFDQFRDSIEKTNEAEKQASINSASFANRVKQLKARFENLIIKGNESSGALNKLGSVLGFVSDHLGLIITLVGSAIILFTSYYAIMTLSRMALVGYNVALDLYILLSGKSILLLQKQGLVLKAYTAYQWLANSAAWGFAAAILANPITWLVAAILATVVAIGILIWKWKELTAWWEKSSVITKGLSSPLILILKPILEIAKGIRSIIDNWQELSDAFKNGGVFEGLKKYGKMFLVNLLEPIQKYLTLLGKIPGMSFAAKAANNIGEYRKELEGETSDNKPVNLERTKTQITQYRSYEELKQLLQIEIQHNKDLKANVKGNSAAIPVTTNTR